MILTPKRFTWAMASFSGVFVIKHRSAEPGMGLKAFGSNFRLFDRSLVFMGGYGNNLEVKNE